MLVALKHRLKEWFPRKPSWALPPDISLGTMQPMGKLECGKIECGKIESGKIECGKIESGKIECGKIEGGFI